MKCGRIFNMATPAAPRSDTTKLAENSHVSPLVDDSDLLDWEGLDILPPPAESGTIAVVFCDITAEPLAIEVD
jgi:hypothetical protein